MNQILLLSRQKNFKEKNFPFGQEIELALNGIGDSYVRQCKYSNSRFFDDVFSAIRQTYEN